MGIISFSNETKYEIKLVLSFGRILYLLLIALWLIPLLLLGGLRGYLIEALNKKTKLGLWLDSLFIAPQFILCHSFYGICFHLL